MVRRVAEPATPAVLTPVVKLLAGEDDASRQRAILRGVQASLKGRPRVAMPADWPDTFVRLSRSPDGEVRSLATALAATFGDRKAFQELHRVLASRDVDPVTRQAALAALVGANDRALVPVLHGLVDDPAMPRGRPARLAAFDDPKTPQVILGIFGKLTAAESAMP